MKQQQFLDFFVQCRVMMDIRAQFVGGGAFSQAGIVYKRIPAANPYKVLLRRALFLIIL